MTQVVVLSTATFKPVLVTELSLLPCCLSVGQPSAHCTLTGAAKAGEHTCKVSLTVVMRSSPSYHEQERTSAATAHTASPPRQHDQHRQQQQHHHQQQKHEEDKGREHHAERQGSSVRRGGTDGHGSGRGNAEAGGDGAYDDDFEDDSESGESGDDGDKADAPLHSPGSAHVRQAARGEKGEEDRQQDAGGSKTHREEQGEAPESSSALHGREALSQAHGSQLREAAVCENSGHTAAAMATSTTGANAAGDGSGGDRDGPDVAAYDRFGVRGLQSPVPGAKRGQQPFMHGRHDHEDTVDVHSHGDAAREQMHRYGASTLTHVNNNDNDNNNSSGSSSSSSSSRGEAAVGGVPAGVRKGGARSQEVQVRCAGHANKRKSR